MVLGATEVERDEDNHERWFGDDQDGDDERYDLFDFPKQRYRK